MSDVPPAQPPAPAGAAAPPALPSPPPHSLFDDVQALATGTLFVALGLVLFRQAGFVTGGTAGIALLLHYATGVGFGPAFFAINLPFYVLAWRRMGPRFTIKTGIAVAALSWLAEVVPVWLPLAGNVQPLFAALGGGLLIGAGLLILFRHQASLGGLNVLVLWLQERRGWRAGHLQMAIDVTILMAAWPWVSSTQLALSVLGAVALNFALAVNHRPGRYAAM